MFYIALTLERLFNTENGNQYNGLVAFSVESKTNLDNMADRDVGLHESGPQQCNFLKLFLTK